MSTWPHGFAVDLASAAEIEAFNAGGLMPICFSTRSTVDPDIKIRGFRSDRLSVWKNRSASGFGIDYRYGQESLVIRFVDRGRLDRRVHRRAYSASADQAMLLVEPEASQLGTTSPHYASLGLTVNGTVMRAANEALSGCARGTIPDFSPMAAVDAPPMQALRRTLSSVHERLGSVSADDAVLLLLEEVLIYQIISFWPQGAPARAASGDAAPSRPAFDRARDYIEANIARPMTLSDIAASAGMSVRSLQLAFKKHLGVAPSTYIIERRLRAVHADLRDPGLHHMGIGQIAGRWGFTHQGEFGQRFRRLFGVRPTDLRLRERPATRAATAAG